MKAWVALVCYFWVISALAQDQEKIPSTPEQAPSQTIAMPVSLPKKAESHSYRLSGLQSVGTSTYPGAVPMTLRFYLHFRNSDGHHYFIYEEDPSLPPLKEINSLQQAMERSGVFCSTQVDCRSKAFCTGKCANMYYQFSNSVVPRGDSGRCRLISFTCVNERASVSSSTQAPSER